MNANILGLIIGLILAVVTVFLILWGRKPAKSIQEPAPQPPAEKPVEMAEKVVVQPVEEKLVEMPKEQVEQPFVEKPPEMPTQDDLVLIEGIGPKIADLLNQQGIKTFAQLAATPVPVLQKILQDNGLKFIKPDSWPEQGRLAAAGKMDELKALQDKLVAGR